MITVLRYLKKRLIFPMLLMLISITSVHAWDGSINYYDHSEPGIGLYHYFTVQIQPSYNDSGYHYARGYWTVSGGADGSVTIDTGWGASASDSRILGTYNYQYRDYWDFSHGDEVVTAYIHSVTVPHGAGYWPI